MQNRDSRDGKRSLVTFRRSVRHQKTDTLTRERKITSSAHDHAMMLEKSSTDNETTSKDGNSSQTNQTQPHNSTHISYLVRTTRTQANQTKQYKATQTRPRKMFATGLLRDRREMLRACHKVSSPPAFPHEQIHPHDDASTSSSSSSSMISTSPIHKSLHGNGSSSNSPHTETPIDASGRRGRSNSNSSSFFGDWLVFDTSSKE
mmetsp:Transcript_3113/g.8810  ORF Transcript_3113/g.8810 Transcript_3113/m.8810 type:complete len:204 (+) Transcript_3113:178-789(+)